PSPLTMLLSCHTFLCRSDSTRREAGRSPGAVPVKYEMAVNLKTAKALGLTVSQSILLRADEVIEWCFAAVHMSALGPTRKCSRSAPTSGYEGTAENILLTLSSSLRDPKLPSAVPQSTQALAILRRARR